MYPLESCDRPMCRTCKIRRALDRQVRCNPCHQRFKLWLDGGDETEWGGGGGGPGGAAGRRRRAPFPSRPRAGHPNQREHLKPLDLRRVICLDLETALIRPGLCSPPVSVCSIFVPGVGARLYGTWQLQPVVEQWLDSDYIIIGHNIAYDMCCLFEWYPALRSKIKKGYEANRILDTGLLWRIIEICKGDMRGRSPVSS